MKKLISLVLILFLSLNYALATSIEDDTDGEYPPERKISQNEIYDFVEKNVIEIFNNIDNSSNWHEKGPKVTLNKDIINTYKENAKGLCVYDIYLEDELHSHPYYSIIVKVEGMYYFTDPLSDLLKDNKLFKRGFIHWSEDKIELSTKIDLSIKMYAKENYGSLKLLGFDLPDNGEGGFKDFVHNFDNFRGLSNIKHTKKGYKIVDKYYYDQLLKAFKGKPVDKNLHFQITSLGNRLY